MFPNILSRRRTARVRAADDAYVLHAAERTTRDEYTRHQAAFEHALAEMDLARLDTPTILDNYLAGVLA
jgi:glutathione S-transferase